MALPSARTAITKVALASSAAAFAAANQELRARIPFNRVPHERFSRNGYSPLRDVDSGKVTALMIASDEGRTGLVEKMLAAGAKAELADEVNGGKGRRVVDASSASGWENREQCACILKLLAAACALFLCMTRLWAVPPVESGYVCQ